MKKELPRVIVVVEDLCINCHACISVCPIKYCNDAHGDHVSIDKDLCIACGQCLDACTHGARVVVDDFENLYKAKSDGVPKVAIVAPSVAANFPDKELHLNGFLKKEFGIEAFFDVSFGADLTVRSYKEYIEKHKPESLIAQPCPTLVNYIEIYRPELIPYLAPVDSPMLHTIKMIGHFYKQYAYHRVVVISPCIAKTREFVATGLGDYNVTFSNLKEYMQEKKVVLSSYEEVPYENPLAGMGTLFSSPGGLTKTMERYFPNISEKTRRIEGTHAVVRYLNILMEDIKSKKAPFLIDCLNCEGGCNTGTGTRHGAWMYSSIWSGAGCNAGPDAQAPEVSLNKLEYAVEKRRKERERYYKTKLFDNIEKAIKKNWDFSLFTRKYTNRMDNYAIKQPSEIQLQEIIKSMNKFTEEDFYNCSSCGYGSCKDMAIAIFNELNKPSNCHHYLMDELSVSKVKAEESDRLKTAFLANMSHEIRTPMNGIMGFSSLLMSPDSSEEERVSYLEIVNDCSKQLLSIISDVLDISLLDSHQMKLTKEVFNVNILIKDLFFIFKEEVEKKEKQIELLTDFALQEEEAFLYSDKYKVRQVLSNIIVNAIKFTNIGSITVGYFFGMPEKNITFFVKDTGRGIPYDKQQTIFERFVQVNRDPAIGGTGLGLSICKEIANLLGGTIRVESEPEAGSTFFVSIPYIKESTTREPVHNKPAKPKAASKDKKTILIVEDEIVNYKYLEKILEKMDYKIIHLPCGKDVLNVVRTHPIDLILLDIRLPDMSGHEIAKMLRKNKIDIPIIAQTAYALQGDKDKCLEAGCNDYISKPIVENDLMKLLNQYM